MTAHTPSSLGGTTTATLRVWLPVLGCLGVACAIFGFTFRREIEGALRVWSDSTAYNHCFLVLPMAVLLLWKRRDVAASLRPSPAPWALLLAVTLSAVWFVAALFDVLEAEQLVVVALFEVLLLAVIGWRAFRALLAPLLFLFFLVPFGAFLVPVLQRITAVFATSGLMLLDIPVFADGLTIQIPEGSFEVAEACAGLRFLIASVVFGCFFATIVYHSPVRRIVFIALSTALPVIANGFRAFGLILLAHLEGSAAAALADHVLYGWIFFTLVTLSLIAIGMTFAERRGPVALQIIDLTQGAPSSRLPIAATMAAGLLIVVLCPGYLMVVERAAVAPADGELLSPRSDSAWVREQGETIDWRPAIGGAGLQSTRMYGDGEAKVVEFVDVYPLPARSSPLTRIGNNMAVPQDWRLAGTGRVNASVGGTTIAVNTITIVRDGQHRLVWWFYLIDGEATGSMFEAKLLQARTALAGGSHFGALVAISTDTDELASDKGALALARFLDSVAVVIAGRWEPVRNDVPGESENQMPHHLIRMVAPI
jgi:exosortase A